MGPGLVLCPNMWFCPEQKELAFILFYYFAGEGSGEGDRALKRLNPLVNEGGDIFLSFPISCLKRNELFILQRRRLYPN